MKYSLLFFFLLLSNFAFSQEILNKEIGSNTNLSIEEIKTLIDSQDDPFVGIYTYCLEDNIDACYDNPIGFAIVKVEDNSYLNISLSNLSFPYLNPENCQFIERSKSIGLIDGILNKAPGINNLEGNILEIEVGIGTFANFNDILELEFDENYSMFKVSDILSDYSKLTGYDDCDEEMMEEIITLSVTSYLSTIGFKRYPSVK